MNRELVDRVAEVVKPEMLWVVVGPRVEGGRASDRPQLLLVDDEGDVVRRLHKCVESVRAIVLKPRSFCFAAPKARADLFWWARSVTWAAACIREWIIRKLLLVTTVDPELFCLIIPDRRVVCVLQKGGNVVFVLG